MSFYDCFNEAVRMDWILKDPDSGIIFGYPKKIKVDLKKKHLIYNGHYLIKNGKIKINTLMNASTGESYSWSSPIDAVAQDFFTEAEKLYEKFYFSRPSERDEKVGLFRAKHLDELSMKEMIDGETRFVTRVQLETFILLSGIEKCYQWENEKHFFWQSKKYPKFIIKREYL